MAAVSREESLGLKTPLFIAWDSLNQAPDVVVSLYEELTVLIWNSPLQVCYLVDEFEVYFNYNANDLFDAIVKTSSNMTQTW